MSLMSREISRLASLTPCSASDGVRRNARSLSARVENTGALAEGEISTTPPGMVTLSAAPMASPVQNGPTSATTWSVLTSLSAAAAPVVALQPPSPVT